MRNKWSYSVKTYGVRMPAWKYQAVVWKSNEFEQELEREQEERREVEEKKENGSSGSKDKY